MYHAALVCMLMHHAVTDDEKVVSCPNCPICHNPVALLPARYERGRRAVGFALWVLAGVLKVHILRIHSGKNAEYANIMLAGILVKVYLTFENSQCIKVVLVWIVGYSGILSYILVKLLDTLGTLAGIFKVL